MKTYISFYDIVEGVKQETGITNLSNRYDEIARLIVRAERDINPYAGHYIQKNVLFKKGSSNFNGNIVKIPNDFISMVRVTIPNSREELPIRDNNTHILIANGLSNQEIILSYWANQMDPEGKPYSALNHFEAIVAFIVWKFYSQFVFQGNGNMNAKVDYKNTYEQFCKGARGADFFPTQKNLDNIHSQQITPKYIEINCDDNSFCMNGIELEDDSIPNVWFWQEDSLQKTYTEEDIDKEFLKDKFSTTIFALQQGMYFTTSSVGRYGIAIKNGPTSPDGIVDVLNNTIADIVDFTYFENEKLLVLISKEYISAATFYLKLN